MAKLAHLATVFIATLPYFTVPAAAQNVYRCGGSYSNEPCAGATLVSTADPRSATERAAADAATRRDAREAMMLEKERLKQEARPAQAILPPPKVEEPAAAQRVAWQAKMKKLEVFSAVSPKPPGTPASRKKAAKKNSA